ncbi:TPA: septum formation protein Maf [Legionella pneumophila subsp. pneumophila]|uniref:Maf family protein n=1 Tax=Legionella pneumophila TaxID=446 RepID=UPI0001E3C5D0|nr:Maf family protein [Legionella pneumophila]MDC8029112.1 Nucleoside triphosphate pyrophosphatase [Legionella pneumophila subsp. pneumophila]MDW8868759.1 Maf family protein [Legionella pneumophila]MDW8914769.1 Maf family protein [Legionella pneumophila]MDW8924169.1 Maf family protein [Legionella pneumophila]MDW8929687.1 Maf family protein [Legionella pneumophila]
MSKFLQQKPIILASSSTIRHKLMKSLGLDFLVVPSNCNEEEIKTRHNSDELVELGITLAKIKALDVSQHYPEHYIIAADQLCIADKRIFNKPLNHQTAVSHLRELSGKQHQQIACLCIVKESKILWQYHETATLTLHHLSEKTIEAYLQAEKPYQSCGAYQYEGLGKWLFKEVQGSEDTILGLPLMPLVNALVNLKVVGI